VLRGLADAVPAVVTAHLALLRTAVRLLAASTESVATFACPLLPALVKLHSGSTAAAARDALLGIGRLRKGMPGTVAAAVLVTDTAAALKTPWRHAVARLQLLALLVAEFRLDGAGVSAHQCMQCAVAFLQHAHAKVRVGAGDVVMEVYSVAGNVVQQYFESLKGPLLEELKAKNSESAKKSRTRTAPMQRLASMVQPMASTADAPPGDAPGKPPRPSTTSDGNAMAGALRAGGSLRERMALWQASQEELAEKTEAVRRKKEQQRDDAGDAEPQVTPARKGPARSSLVHNAEFGDSVASGVMTMDDLDDVDSAAAILAVVRPAFKKKGHLIFS
jgi:hypothetical protein